MEDLQIEGLRDSIRFLNELIEEEAALVGCSSRVILLGISQGCATGLLTFLAGKLRLGAFVGLNEWMPFKAQIEGTVKPGPREELKDRLAEFFKKTFGLEIQTQKIDCRPQFCKTPVFLGLTTDDDVVDVKQGQEARRVLSKMGIDAF